MSMVNSVILFEALKVFYVCGIFISVISLFYILLRDILDGGEPGPMEVSLVIFLIVIWPVFFWIGVTVLGDNIRRAWKEGRGESIKDKCDETLYFNPKDCSQYLTQTFNIQEKEPNVRFKRLRWIFDNIYRIFAVAIVLLLVWNAVYLNSLWVQSRVDPVCVQLDITEINSEGISLRLWNRCLFTWIDLDKFDVRASLTPVVGSSA